MAKKKKVNPHRIPLSKNAFNKDAILAEAMKDQMTHAWLLVAEPLIEAGYDLMSLSEYVAEYMRIGIKEKDMDSDLKRAYSDLGFKFVSLASSRVKSPVELEAYRRKVEQAVLNNDLCIIYLGLEKKLEKEALQKIFFSADLTRAELEHGMTNYDELKERLVDLDYDLSIITFENER